MKIIQVLWAVGLMALNTVAATEELTEITVYRSPTCGCCEKWLAHLEQNKFVIKDVVVNDVQVIKNQYGVKPELASCHTALTNGYVIEGHVPASDIRNLLKTRPKVVGIAVPGMPKGTPGMEMGAKKDAYDVVSFDDKNHIEVFNHYNGN